MAGALQGLVNSIVATTAGLPDPRELATWSPALSGDIPIVIGRDGAWEHAGGLIQREGLVRLFASLLRREDDGHYYLVTPVEKWRIQVQGHALVAIDCACTDCHGERVWFVLLNTGGRCHLGGACRLIPPGDDPAPWVSLPNGLSAQLTRAAWYRLIDAATLVDGRALIVSAGETINLGAIE